MRHLAKKSHAAGQVVRPDEDCIESGYGQYLFKIGNSLAVLDLNDHDSLIIGGFQVLCELQPKALGSSQPHTSLTQRRILRKSYDLTGVSFGIHHRYDNAAASGVEDSFNVFSGSVGYSHEGIA